MQNAKSTAAKEVSFFVKVTIEYDELSDVLGSGEVQSPELLREVIEDEISRAVCAIEEYEGFAVEAKLLKSEPAHQALYEALSAQELVAQFENARDAAERIRLLESLGDFDAGRPKLDPLTQREISDDCWDGFHYKTNSEGISCVGWIPRGKDKEFKRCQCACHDDRAPRIRKVKPISMPLPDVGTIEV